MMATTQQISKEEGREATALRSAALAGEAVPQRVLLAPWGQVESTNGSFVVDEESANLTLRAFDEHGTDLPIDYEHQTLGGTYSSPNGQAPAAGWVKRLLAEPGVGLVAEIEWTDQAKKMLAAKEYRYLSPVAIIRKTDRKLVAIHSAALTNKPAIVGMRPIVNRAGTQSDEDRAEPLSVLRDELDLPVDAAPEEVLLAASQRLADLERDARQSQVEQRVQEAMRAGKLVEAQRAWAEALVACEEELFDEWFRTAPVIVQRGALVPPYGTNASQQSERATAAQARAEFRANPMLTRLTSEEAYVADALSRAGC
jgi:phage I-like protein